MIVITAEWLAPNEDGPPSKKLIGGLLICQAAEDATKDYAGMVVDKDAAPVHYLALDGDLDKEGWQPVIQRALKHPGFDEEIPDHWIKIFADLLADAQAAGCLNGPLGTPDDHAPRHLTLIDPPDAG